MRIPGRRVADFFTGSGTVFSFEFFPPKTEVGWEKLASAIKQEFLPLEPAYVSVTYGAGGSTRQRTHRMVSRIQEEFGLTVVAHLTCIGSSREEIEGILCEYDRAGVHNILALRGDTPGGETPAGDTPAGGSTADFPHAADLVSFIRSRYPHFSIGVAGFPEGHPAEPNRLKEMQFLKDKVDAGADYIVTQLFFENRDYQDFVDRARLAGIDVPVVPGIMPITSRTGLNRMADLAAGTRFPAPLLRALDRVSDDQGVERVGTHWATAQVADLLNRDVPGIHLYTLNHSRATVQICRNLGLQSYRSVVMPESKKELSDL